MDKCLNEKCSHYNNVVEFANDGCTYGCSEKDFDVEKPCNKNKEKDNE